MNTDVKKYVAGCDICQRMKNQPRQPYGPLIPNPVPGVPACTYINPLDFTLKSPDSTSCPLTSSSRELTRRRLSLPLSPSLSLVLIIPTSVAVPTSPVVVRITFVTDSHVLVIEYFGVVVTDPLR